MDKDREYDLEHEKMREARNEMPWIEDPEGGESIYFLELREWKPKEKEWAPWEACGTAKDYETAVNQYIQLLDTFPRDHIRVIEAQIFGAICTHTPINK